MVRLGNTAKDRVADSPLTSTAHEKNGIVSGTRITTGNAIAITSHETALPNPPNDLHNTTLCADRAGMARSCAQ